MLVLKVVVDVDDDESGDGWWKIFFVGWRRSLNTQPVPGSGGEKFFTVASRHSKNFTIKCVVQQ